MVSANSKSAKEDNVISEHPPQISAEQLAELQARAQYSDQLTMELIELLFFAYRDFVSDPDAILTEMGFGRAHHRVLHFVRANPGIRVADLLEILAITKQSLARVLRQLIDYGFIEQRQGPIDRRERLLFATESGLDLADRLSRPQVDRLKRVIAELGPNNATTAQRFLTLMRTPSES